MCSYLYVIGYLGLLWFLIFTCFHSCELGISNNTDFAVYKNKMLWFPFFYLIYSGYDGVWHWYCITYPSGNILCRVKSHKLESTLGVSTWAKAYCGFFPSSLDISWFIILMDLAVMADLEGQVSLIVKDISVHDGLGYVRSLYSSFCWEVI